jgi:hypothetical protein
VVAEVKLVARRPNCASIFFTCQQSTVQQVWKVHSPRVHVLHRWPTVGIGETSKGIRLPHLGTDGLVRRVAIAGECAAVCFLYAWRLGFVLVVGYNLSVWREEARVPAVWSAVALIGVWIWRCSCVGRSGMTQLF